MGEKREYWLKHIEAWEQSGETQASYCRKRELSVSSFQYYLYQDKRRKRREEDGFVALGVKEVREIELRKGEVSVFLPLDMQPEKLAELVACLS